MENCGNKLFKKDSCIEALYRKFKGVCKRPCYHTVCQRPTINRSLLSRNDYLNILSTPRGYVWTGLASYSNDVANNVSTRKVDISSKQQKRGPLKENIVVSTKEHQATITQALKPGKLNAADKKMWERLFKKELAESPEFAKEYQMMQNNLQKNGKLNHVDKKKWEELFKKKLDDPESAKEYQLMTNHKQKSIVAQRMQKFGMHSSLEPNKRGPILKKDKQLSEYPEFVKGYQKKLSLLLKSGKLNAADQKMLEHLFEKELAGSPEFSKEYQRMVNNLQKYGKLSPADQKKWEKHLEKKLDNSSEFVKEYQSMANHMQKYGKLSPADEKIWGHIFKDDSTDSGIGKKGLNQGSRRPTNESKIKKRLLSSSLPGDKKKFKKDKQIKLRAKSIQNLENENIQKEDLLKKRTEAILNVKKETFLKSEKKRKKEEEKLRKLKAREEIIKKNAEKVMQSEERKRLREEELKNRRRDDKKNEDAKRTEIMRIKEHEERVKLKETNEKIRKLEDLEKEAKRILQEEQQWREKINREFAMKMRYTNDPNNCILAIIPNLVNNEDDYKIGKKGKDRFIQYTKRQLEKIKKRDKIFDYGNLMKEIIQRELGNTQNNHPKLYENKKLCNNQSLDPYRKSAMIDNTTSRWIQNKNVAFKSCCPLNNLADFNELYIQNGLVSHKHCSL